ncbi:MAG: photosystem II complex extrinsic protein PsbU [Aphanocapsa feldmannii 277cV]|uniref:Photosystem II extrinsic protein U n=2 Tax=Aphanocapsa feldmannii TaxID=192050 RepID=A0A524RR99_9CHRO|nr:MAG: photosystem II complex extrinsic protein PsbU [Aphanocapsa feldmannii 288cV]TGG96846.1 MAG: photosystem II complex extrinsic protein PsbU [Aphanocapsa feldmannii 277cV]TGH26421.1 MAG: photosystem II complex extrinsic protein PsbU [Aphanocapsa feldmannii 277cI]
MKRLASWLLSGLLITGIAIGLAGGLWFAPVVNAEMRNVADDKLADLQGKVDLNNSSVRSFQQFPGMYPTLAGKIVVGGPYRSVDDVMKLNLTERQRELVDKYKDSFIVTDAEIALNEGFDRINDGQYR